ncbi:MAG: sterol desaturase family protein [Deltaproteobacteria bacterium]|nr:sterol desaturase family protein [Deltaproteobacteria bacterium]
MWLVFASALVVLLLMEPWSAWVHRVVWHGRLWLAHRSHHRERIGAEPGGLVANDALSAAHAPVAMALILAGLLVPGAAGQGLLGAGIGMTLFGALYVVFHDGMVHGRLPVAGLLRFRAFAAMRDAHQLHHQSNGAPFGFFASPWLMRAGRSLSPRVAPRPARRDDAGSRSDRASSVAPSPR